jgi:sarcosine oxidase
MDKFDVIVIGSGLTGAATAWRLSERGLKVLVLEQYAVGHERGSSHGATRIFRYAYDHQAYVKLARIARPLWDELEAASGQKLITVTGGIDFGSCGNAVFDRVDKSLTACAIAHERLTSAAIMERFPQFILPETVEGIYQPDTAIVRAAQSVRAMIDLAIKNGATLMENQSVVRVQVDPVRVVTEDAVYQADRVVIAAGAFASKLLASSGFKQAPLTVTKEQYLYLESPQPELFDVGKFPVFIDYDGCAGGADHLSMYGFPRLENDFIKVSWHMSGAVVDPFERDFVLDQSRVDVILDYVKNRLPEAFGPVREFATCLYTTTADEHFILDFIDSSKTVFLASACSGHGFKFGPALGELITNLVTPMTSASPSGCALAGLYESELANLFSLG